MALISSIIVNFAIEPTISKPLASNERQKHNTLYLLLGMLVIVLFTSIFTACSDNSAEKQLSQAESLIIEQPDSTVAYRVVEGC